MYWKIKKNQIERVQIVKTNCKMTLKQVVTKYKPDYAINGGLYSMKTGRVNAIPLRIDGKTVATSKNGYWVLAWNEGPDICMAHSTEMTKYQNAIACSTMLKDGKETIFNFTPAQGGVRGRTAIGDSNDELHLFVTTDAKGALSPYSLRNRMKSGGAENAIMLDCGGSSQGYAKGRYYQSEDRKVSWWILVFLKKKTTDEPSKTPFICPFKAPTCTLRMGHTGESVKWLQWCLRATVAPELPITGEFWGLTRAAVAEFQRKYGLDVDGVVGPATRAALIKAVQ
jgi:peptidoglycan hydrolase-like protein with peptidoglycan-binding domain